jgi:hypothetical protein
MALTSFTHTHHSVACAHACLGILWMRLRLRCTMAALNAGAPRVDVRERTAPWGGRGWGLGFRVQGLGTLGMMWMGLRPMRVMKASSSDFITILRTHARTPHTTACQ